MAGLENVDEMFDLRMSEGAKPLFEKVKTFIKEEVEPITLEFHRLGENREDRWSWAPGQLELLDGVKAKAKAMDLWNFFLPDSETARILVPAELRSQAAQITLAISDEPVGGSPTGAPTGDVLAAGAMSEL